MADIVLKKLCAVPAGTDGYVMVSQSVAADNSLLFLFIEPSGKEAVAGRTENNGFATFPKPRMGAPCRFRLVRVGEGSVQTADLPPLDLTFPMVDVFPDGRVLIVGPRCSWRSETDFDRNGAVIDPSTGAVSRILLGDGIENIAVDTRGRIWAGYFDEGVFGNFGWSDPGPKPVGAAGLVCFSDTGEKLWEYPSERHAPIDDCYALNVCGDKAAIYYYSDFPVCTVSRDFTLTFRQTAVHGCKAFALSGERVLFSGQYNDSPHIGYRGTLDPDRAGEMTQVGFVLAGGVPVQADRITGRGSTLYFFAEDAVYAADLDAATS
ncbi:MAG TPA: hypothetical protein VII56_23175 [Rhizomicrobium sp.]